MPQYCFLYVILWEYTLYLNNMQLITFLNDMLIIFPWIIPWYSAYAFLNRLRKISFQSNSIFFINLSHSLLYLPIFSSSTYLCQCTHVSVVSLHTNLSLAHICASIHLIVALFCYIISGTVQHCIKWLPSFLTWIFLSHHCPLWHIIWASASRLSCL